MSKKYLYYFSEGNDAFGGDKVTMKNILGGKGRRCYQEGKKQCGECRCREVNTFSGKKRGRPKPS